jgi:threonine dehydrogenase-like Zn-dependent dehydrogenase
LPIFPERIALGEIDASFVVTHRVPLQDAPRVYDVFSNKHEDAIKIVLKPQSIGQADISDKDLPWITN